MKRSLKKQVETELMEAIEKLLSRHNKKAIAKTKKSVKNAAKSVAKKFGKVIKGLEEKKKPARKRKSAVVANEAPRTRRPYRRKTKLVSGLEGTAISMESVAEMPATQPS